MKNEKIALLNTYDGRKRKKKRICNLKEKLGRKLKEYVKECVESITERKKTKKKIPCL